MLFLRINVSKNKSAWNSLFYVINLGDLSFDILIMLFYFTYFINQLNFL